MKVFLVLACLFVAVHGKSILSSDVNEWLSYKETYGKSYSKPEEDQLRMKIFLAKKEAIAAHNVKYEKGEVTYEKGLNKFSDMTFDEFKSRYFSKFQESKPKANNIFKMADNYIIPSAIDWRTKKLVTEVKDQGLCGSCWSFSVIAALEGQYASATGTLVSLSEQQLLDCAGEKYHNEGCVFGGDMIGGYQYIIDNGGVTSYAAYPYTQEIDDCRSQQMEMIAKISTYYQSEVGNETALTNLIGQLGPVSIAIEVTDGIKDYKSGVFYDETCTGKRENLHHAVVAVGYGTTENGTDFYIVKNSWGVVYGEEGYIRMSRNRNDNCGVSLYATVPLI